MKSGKKTLSLCLATSLMVTSLNALAAMPTQSELMKMGPNQLVSQGQNILWNSAYRVDKELIGKSESHTSFDHVATSVSSGGGTNLGRFFAGAVIGGLAAGLAAPAFGVGAMIASTAGGAVLGGGLTMENATNSSSNDETHYQSDSKSETYQIHDKANTWVIIAMDKDAYLASRDQISKSAIFMNSTCAKQGRAFLDEVVSNYHVASANDLENLSTIVQQLNEKKIALDVEADKTNSLNPLAEKIEAFDSQRVRVVRLNWKSILLRTGQCSTGQDLEQNLKTEANNLFNDITKTSVIADSNSMALISNVTFSKLPDKGLSQAQSNVLKASQARLLIYQAQTLKALEDGNYIEIRDGKILETKNMHALNAALQKREDLLKRDQSLQGPSVMGTAFLVPFGLAMGAMVTSIKDKSVAYPLSFASMGASVAFGTGNDYIQKKQLEHSSDFSSAQKVIVQDANFNRVIDQNIALNEQVYDLAGNKDYQNLRNQIIANYKANVAMQIAIHQGKLVRSDEASEKEANWLTNFPYYLIQCNILDGSQVAQMRNIFDVMKGNSISSESISLTAPQLNQIETLSAMTHQMADDSKDAAQKAKLQDLASQLDKEKQVLSFLK